MHISVRILCFYLCYCSPSVWFVLCLMPVCVLDYARMFLFFGQIPIFPIHSYAGQIDPWGKGMLFLTTNSSNPVNIFFFCVWIPISSVTIVLRSWTSPKWKIKTNNFRSKWPKDSISHNHQPVFVFSLSDSWYLGENSSRWRKKE